MRKGKKMIALVCSLLAAICGFSGRAYADGSAWEIEHTLDLSECRQGDTVKMSVNLKGSSASGSQKLRSVSGTLEYDTSLFTVEKADLLAPEGAKVQECTFDKTTGIFSLQYETDITVKNGGLLLQILLHTAADATTGNTTLCVTDLKWKGSESKEETEIEHRIPSKITIAESAASVGDVNQDGNINLTDAKLVMQHYNGAAELEGQQLKNADTNGDGNVNLTDAKRIMQYYNGEIPAF